MKVHAPVKGFNGMVAGVQFRDGVADTDKDTPPGVLAYFRRHGYGIGSKPEPVEVPEPPDPREVTERKVGTALRDAAVDPRDDDFLAPTNAGKANPHGPEVVSPEIHASQGVRPVKGGDVHVDEPATQDSEEKAHATEVLEDGATVAASVERPAGNASRDEWAAYAEAQGVDVSDDMSRNDLRDMFPVED